MLWTISLGVILTSAAVAGLWLQEVCGVELDQESIELEGIEQDLNI